MCAYLSLNGCGQPIALPHGALNDRKTEAYTDMGATGIRGW